MYANNIMQILSKYVDQMISENFILQHDNSSIHIVKYIFLEANKIEFFL